MAARGYAAATVLFLLAAASVAPSFAAAGGGADKPLEVKLDRLDGGRLRLSELRGKPVLLKLWATWCLPCRDQARILHDLRDELSARGFAVYAVDEAEAPKVVREFLAGEPSDFPVLLDRFQTLAKLLDVGELPDLAVLRADGTLAGVRHGLTKRDDVLALLGTAAGDAASAARYPK
jgi:thiol-disulfide isomerase/thioredoxin